MRRVFSLLVCILFVLPAFSVCAKAAEPYGYPEPEVLQIDLIIQPYRYLKMIRSEEKQKYDAVVCINEGDPQKIGVQVRGHNSLHDGMRSSSKRIPLELCFDYADPDGSFRGNPSLKLINCLTPARLLTQFIAMQAFEFLGVPTPRITPAFLRINDTDFGMYLAVEDLNETFAQSRFGGASLYRPISEKDDRDALSTFFFDMSEMVTKVDDGGDTVERFLNALNRGENAESFFDADEFLRYMACETFLLNDDGFLQSGRNFYLADDHGKLKLLPWDQEDVFFVFNTYENYQSFEDRCNSLFQHLTENGAYYAQYREYIRLLNDAFLDPDRFLPWLESYIRFLTPYFQRDETIALRSDDDLAALTAGNELFNSATGNLLLTFKTYHDQARAMLSGEAETFSVPQDTTLTSRGFDYDETNLKKDASIPSRVSAGYWRLRRQAFLQDDGKVTLLIGGFFACVFLLTVLCVYRPTRRPRRKKHKTGGTTS